MLFDAQRRLVGIIDWEWAHTVPVESALILPFNLAGDVKPKSIRPIQEFKDMAVELFRKKVPKSAENKVQGTKQRQTAACLDRYD